MSQLTDYKELAVCVDSDGQFSAHRYIDRRLSQNYENDALAVANSLIELKKKVDELHKTQFNVRCIIDVERYDDEAANFISAHVTSLKDSRYGRTYRVVHGNQRDELKCEDIFKDTPENRNFMKRITLLGQKIHELQTRKVKLADKLVHFTDEELLNQ